MVLARVKHSTYVQGVMAAMKSASAAVGNNTPVLQLCNVEGFIAAGLSNGNVCILQQRQEGLQQIGMLKSHTAAVRGKVHHHRFALTRACL